MFFFEKKNQKTLTIWLQRWGSTGTNIWKFFASFFQKRSPGFAIFAPRQNGARPGV